MPISMVEAKRESIPWSLTNGTTSTATAAVAADIMPGLPPTKEMITAMENDEYSPTLGSTPAMMEKPMASGIRARETRMPARISERGLAIHSRRNIEKKDSIWLTRSQQTRHHTKRGMRVELGEGQRL